MKIDTKRMRQCGIEYEGMCDELDRLYAIEKKTNPSLEGLSIPIFADRRNLKPQILRDCGVAIGELFPIVSNWLSVAADELDRTTPYATREALEAALKEAGWEETWPTSGCWVRTCDIENETADDVPCIEFEDGMLHIGGISGSFHCSSEEAPFRVTPALLEELGVKK